MGTKKPKTSESWLEPLQILKIVAQQGIEIWNISCVNLVSGPLEFLQLSLNHLVTSDTNVIITLSYISRAPVKLITTVVVKETCLSIFKGAAYG